MSQPVNRGTLALVSPCHSAPFYISTRTEGLQYLTSEVPDEIECTAVGCFNAWNADGTPTEYNKDYPEVAED